MNFHARRQCWTHFFIFPSLVAPNCALRAPPLLRLTHTSLNDSQTIHFSPSSLLSRTLWSHNEIGRFYLTTEVQIRIRTRAADSLFKVTTLKRTSIVWRTEKDGERNEWDRVLENSSDTPLRIQYVLSMTTRNPFRWSALPILSFRPSTDDQLHPPFGNKKKTVALLISTIVVLGLSAHLFSVLADPARSEC